MRGPDRVRPAQLGGCWPRDFRPNRLQGLCLLRLSLRTRLHPRQLSGPLRQSRLLQSQLCRLPLRQRLWPARTSPTYPSPRCLALNKTIRHDISTSLPRLHLLQPQIAPTWWNSARRTLPIHPARQQVRVSRLFQVPPITFSPPRRNRPRTTPHPYPWTTPHSSPLRLSPQHLCDKSAPHGSARRLATVRCLQDRATQQARESRMLLRLIERNPSISPACARVWLPLAH